MISHRPRLNKPVLAWREYHSDNSEPCTIWVSPAGAVARRTCRPARNSGPHALCAPADHRNTYTGICGVDPAVVEAGRGMGLTESAASVSGRAPASSECNSFGGASSRRDFGRPCDDRGGYRRWWAWESLFFVAWRWSMIA